MTALAAGVVLGVLSRIEEVVDGFSIGISSNTTWVAVAFLMGATARGAARGGLAGIAAMTAANAAYYGWIAATEPGTPLASVAGSPAAWVALGLLTGAVFGPAGALWAAAPPPHKLLASVPLAAVLVVIGFTDVAEPLLP